MSGDDLARLIGLLGALVLVLGALSARGAPLDRNGRLWRWSALWIGIFAAAALIAAYFT